MGDACWGIEQPNWTGTWGWDELMTEEEQSKRIGVERYPMFAVGFKNLSSNATIEAWQRGEDFANRNVASSSRGVVGSTGTNTPMQPMMQAVQAPASMR